MPIHESARIHPSAKVHPTATIEAGVAIGEETEIGPGCRIRNDARIGDHCQIESDLIGRNTQIGDRSRLRGKSVVQDGSQLGHDTCVGAEANVGSDTEIEPFCVIGDRVEIGARTTMRMGVTIGFPPIDDNVPPCRVGNDCWLGDEVQTGADVQIGDGCEIGPQARLKHGARAEPGAEVGNQSIIDVGTSVAAGKRVPDWTALMADGETIPYGQYKPKPANHEKYCWVEIERGGESVERSPATLGEEAGRIYLGSRLTEPGIDIARYMAAQSEEPGKATVRVSGSDRIPEWATTAVVETRRGPIDQPVHRSVVIEDEDGNRQTRNAAEDRKPQPGETAFHAVAILDPRTHEDLKDALTAGARFVDEGVIDRALKEVDPVYARGVGSREDALEEQARVNRLDQDSPTPVHYVPGRPEIRFEPGVVCPREGGVRTATTGPEPRRLTPGRGAPARPAVTAPAPTDRQPTRSPADGAPAR